MLLWMGIWSHQWGCYLHMCCPTLGKTAEILVYCWATNDTRVLQWLRLWSNLEWFPHPLSTYKRSLTIFICCRLAYGAIITSLPPHVLANCHWKWGHQLKSSVPVGLQKTPLCSRCGSDPTQNGSHIPSQHIPGVWHPSYDVNWHMEPLSGCYPQRCWPRLGKSAEILCPNWATTTNDTRILQWLRLQPNMKWFPHPVPESQQIEGVWQSSYAVDEHHIKQSSGCYHHMCWPRLRLGHCAEIQCLRWVTTNDTIQAPYQHKMGSTSCPSI